jgi:hypothetical protein
MHRLQVQDEVLGRVQVQARQESILNSLDPRAKRLRAADRSLQQARSGLLGAQLALQDLPRTSLSPVNDALRAITTAAEQIDAAAAALDEARLETQDGL